MAKFAWYQGDSTKVLQEFEGDWLEINGDVVCVATKKPASNDGHIMNVVRLNPGQVVKKIG